MNLQLSNQFDFTNRIFSQIKLRKPETQSGNTFDHTHDINTHTYTHTKHIKPELRSQECDSKTEWIACIKLGFAFQNLPTP